MFLKKGFGKSGDVKEKFVELLPCEFCYDYEKVKM